MLNAVHHLAGRPFEKRTTKSGVSYLHFPLHGNNKGLDAAAAVHEAGYAHNNGSGRSAPLFTGNSLALSGGTTGIWTNPGVITPGTQQCYHRDTSAALREFLRWDTLAGTGCFAIALRFFASSSPSGDEYVFDCGIDTTGNGGYGIRYNSSGSLSWHYDPISGSGQAPGKNISTGTTQIAFFWMNGIDAQLEAWFNGTQNGTALAMNGGTAQFPSLSTFENNRGFVLLGKKNEADSTIISLLGNAGSGARLSDLMLFRLDYDARAEKTTAIAQHNASPMRIPQIWLSDV